MYILNVQASFVLILCNRRIFFFARLCNEIKDSCIVVNNFYVVVVVAAAATVNEIKLKPITREPLFAVSFE